MSMFVGHISAFAHWRNMHPGQDVQSDLTQGKLSRLFGSEKIDLVVTDKKQRTARKRFNYHVCSQELPKRSYVRICEGVYVARPELCFLQMAEMLSFVGLVQLGMELCGSYRFERGSGFRSDCPALATRESLERYVLSVREYRGREKALRAIKWIVNDAASPRETQTYIRLCLPPRYGGYSCPKPVLNGLVELTKDQRNLADRSYLRGDLYWPAQNVLLEYNGEDFHSSRGQMTRDALRANAVASKGADMFTVTADVYGNFASFDALARELQKKLGVRLRSPTADQMQKRRDLVRELYKQEKLTR